MDFATCRVLVCALERYICEARSSVQNVNLKAHPKEQCVIQIMKDLI